jgi:2-polyprenyl-3-methyl-5-hydroxy-6-metoxy-1,4-benzoquinol methylase
MRTRLHNAGNVDYQVVRSNDAWPDHQARTLVTAALIAWLRPLSILDPACGDGSIVVAADRIHRIDIASFADLSEPNITYLATSERRAGWEFGVGSIETTLDAYRGGADVVVLTEIIEHLEDPDTILRLAREKSRYLVASSPEMRPGQIDRNPEHLWQFDADGYRGMLGGAGWQVNQRTTLYFPSEYDFQIWVCS